MRKGMLVFVGSFLAAGLTLAAEGPWQVFHASAALTGQNLFTGLGTIYSVEVSSPGASGTLTLSDSKDSHNESRCVLHLDASAKKEPIVLDTQVSSGAYLTTVGTADIVILYKQAAGSKKNAAATCSSYATKAVRSEATRVYKVLSSSGAAGASNVSLYNAWNTAVNVKGVWDAATAFSSDFDVQFSSGLTLGPSGSACYTVIYGK